MDIIYQLNPKREEIDFLEQKLLQFNRSKIDPYVYENFILKILDGSETLIAGLHGQTGGNWLYIATLWVDKNHRGRGLGKKLLSRAEEDARKKNCCGIYLYTYSFQSPKFYEELGYQTFGTLDGFCGDHAKLYMKKKFA